MRQYKRLPKDVIQGTLVQAWRWRVELEDTEGQVSKRNETGS